MRGNGDLPPPKYVIVSQAPKSDFMGEKMYQDLFSFLFFLLLFVYERQLL